MFKQPKRLYLSNGYADIEGILETNYPFIFIIGSRGVGKTFGALKYQLIESSKEKNHNNGFCYLRRTMTQLDTISDPLTSPFMNRELIDSIGFSPVITKLTAKLKGIAKKEDDNVHVLGFTAALSTISNIRGFDASWIRRIIYDEFIPEKHERALKAEGAALLNAYETINRNRELKKEDPVQLVCLANSNDIANPVFLELELINWADKAQKNKTHYVTLESRGILIVSLENSPISGLKNETALYKAAVNNSDFKNMALINKYTGSYTETSSMNLKEYKAVVTCGSLCIYEHKFNRTFYATSHNSGSPVKIDSTEIGLAKFRMKYHWLFTAYMEEMIIFENRYMEALFQTYFKLR